MAGLISKAIAIWLLLLVIAIGNAIFRENLLAPAIGSPAALPVSGLLLALLILLAAFVTVPVFHSSEGKIYGLVGVVWFVLTLAFELLFGHFVTGKPWHEVLQVFSIWQGDLFVVALLSTVGSPWLAARMRGLIE